MYCTVESCINTRTVMRTDCSCAAFQIDVLQRKMLCVNSVKHPPNSVVFVCVLFSICDLVFFMSNSLAFLILVSFDVCVLSNLFDGVRCSSSFWQIRTHNGNLVNHSFNSCCYVRLYNFVTSHVNASSVAKRPTPRIVRYITMDPNGN